MSKPLMPDFCERCDSWHVDGLRHYLNDHPDSNIPRWIVVNWISNEEGRCPECFQRFEDPYYHFVKVHGSSTDGLDREGNSNGLVHEDGPDGLDHEGDVASNGLDIYVCACCSGKVVGSDAFKVRAYTFVYDIACGLLCVSVTLLTSPLTNCRFYQEHLPGCSERHSAGVRASEPRDEQHPGSNSEGSP